MPEASLQLKTLFATMAAALVVLFALGVRAAWLRTGAGGTAADRAGGLALLGGVAWAAITLAAAASGRLHFDGTPPTMFGVVFGMLAIALGVGMSPVGARLAAGLPLAVLVGVQGFRLPLELMMHRAASEGVMPPQMSYSGLNFDIATGALAVVVAGLLLAGRASHGLVRAWNWLGVTLLAGIIAISILSTPVPFRVFMNEPANVWVAQPPFVWLPAIMVLAAVLGHVVIFRRLRLERARAAARAPVGTPWDGRNQEIPYR